MRRGTAAEQVTAEQQHVAADNHQRREGSQERGELLRVDHILYVAIDEAALVAVVTGPAPKPLLERRERALVADGDDPNRPGDGRYVEPQESGPTPGGDERAHGDENDERQVDDHHRIGQHVEHHVQPRS